MRRYRIAPPAAVAAAATLALLFSAGCASVRDAKPPAATPGRGATPGKTVPSAGGKKKETKGSASKEAIRLFNLAQGKIESGDYAAAESLLQKAAAADPNLFPAYVALGGVYEKLGKKKEAAGAYRRTLALRPGHVKSHIALGKIAFEKKEYERAIFRFEKAVELDPGSFMAHYRLGLIRRRRKQTAMAVYHLKAASRISPEHRAARYWLWLSVSEQGGPRAWEVELGRGVVESGNEAPVRYYRGRAARHFRAGRVGKAIEAIQKAVDVNPRWRDRRWRGVLEDMTRYRRAGEK